MMQDTNVAAAVLFRHAMGASESLPLSCGPQRLLDLQAWPASLLCLGQADHTSARSADVLPELPQVPAYSDAIQVALLRAE